MVTHEQMIETIDYLDKLVNTKFPAPRGVTETSLNWIQNRKLRNDLWTFKEMIKQDR